MTVGSVATAVHMCLRGAEAVLRRTVLCRAGARAAAGAQARATCMVEGVGQVDRALGLRWDLVRPRVQSVMLHAMRREARSGLSVPQPRARHSR